MSYLTRTLHIFPAAALYGLLAGVSWHTVTLAVDTFHGLLRAF